MCRPDDFPPYPERDPYVEPDPYAEARERVSEAALLRGTARRPAVAYTTLTSEDYVMAEPDPPMLPKGIDAPPFWAIIHPTGAVSFIPGKPTVTELQHAVGGYIEGVPAMDDAGGFDESYTAYCNEEGKLDGLPVNRPATKFCRVDGFDVLVGPVVIIGPPDEEGDDTPLPEAVRMRLVREVVG